MTGLFDNIPNESARDEAISASIAVHGSEVHLARAVARELALRSEGKVCHADRVGRVFEVLGLPWGTGWTGGIFRTSDWEHTGKCIKSKRKSRHAGIQWIYTYTGPEGSDPVVYDLILLAAKKRPQGATT